MQADCIYWRLLPYSCLQDEYRIQGQNQEEVCRKMKFNQYLFFLYIGMGILTLIVGLHFSYISSKEPYLIPLWQIGLVNWSFVIAGILFMFSLLYLQLMNIQNCIIKEKER